MVPDVLGEACWDCGRDISRMLLDELNSESALLTLLNFLFRAMSSSVKTRPLLEGSLNEETTKVKHGDSIMYVNYIKINVAYCWIYRSELNSTLTNRMSHPVPEYDPARGRVSRESESSRGESRSLVG